MNKTTYYLIAVLVMAVMSYLPRALPFLLVRQKVQNRFLQSFLHYMPVAVLGAMTFPSILYATATPWSAVSFCRLPLLPVAAASTLTVFVTEWIMQIPF